MWGAISGMGEELRELATREDSSESADEEQEASPEVSQEKVLEALCIVTNPKPLFGNPPKVPAVSFGIFDAASIRYSDSSIVPKQSVPPK